MSGCIPNKENLMDKNAELTKVVNGAAILSLALIVLNFVLGLPFSFQAVAVCLLVAVAVGNVALKRPLLVVFMWTAFAGLYALNSMQLYLPTLIKLLS